MDTEAAQQHEPALYIGNFRHASSRLLGLPPAVVQQLADAGLEFQKSDADAKSEPQSWHTLYHRKAIVHFPYEISTMSIFEQYSAGVVLLFPSRRFFEEMMQNSLAEQDGKPAITDSGSLRSLTSVYWKQSTATFRLRLSPHELHQLPGEELTSWFGALFQLCFAGDKCVSLIDPINFAPQRSPTSRTRSSTLSNRKAKTSGLTPLEIPSESYPTRCAVPWTLDGGWTVSP